MTRLIPLHETRKPLSFRVYNRWVDTKTLKRKFGVQAKAKGWKRWRHVAVNHEALIFDTKDEAQRKCEELNHPLPGNCP